MRLADSGMSGFPALVLFDLDGTLLDSAPDFVATINRLRSDRGEASISMATLRPHVSKGARAMLAVAFPTLDEATRDAMIAVFLQVYQQELARHGQPFDGVEALLEAIERAGSRWGIVTNKPEYLARQLLPLLRWDARCAVLIGGDTLPVRKPDPEPLLHAARMLDLEAGQCVYVGDDERDIIAARAARMPSIAALWGYRLDEDDPASWNADAAVDTPHELMRRDAWPRTR